MAGRRHSVEVDPDGGNAGKPAFDAGRIADAGGNGVAVAQQASSHMTTDETRGAEEKDLQERDLRSKGGDALQSVSISPPSLSSASAKVY